jgi:hypothetical protein
MFEKKLVDPIIGSKYPGCAFAKLSASLILASNASMHGQRSCFLSP